MIIIRNLQGDRYLQKTTRLNRHNGLENGIQDAQCHGGLLMEIRNFEYFLLRRYETLHPDELSSFGQYAADSKY